MQNTWCRVAALLKLFCSLSPSANVQGLVSFCAAFCAACSHLACPCKGPPPLGPGPPQGTPLLFLSSDWLALESHTQASPVLKTFLPESLLYSFPVCLSLLTFLHTWLSFSDELSTPTASVSSPSSYLFIACHWALFSSPWLKPLWEVIRTCSLLKWVSFRLGIICILFICYSICFSCIYTIHTYMYHIHVVYIVA